MADRQDTFLKDLAETRGFSLGRPMGSQLTPDGQSVLFLRGGPRDPVLRLYEMSVETGETKEALTPEALQGADEQLSVEERARRERQRVTLRGFTRFELSQDGRRILLPFSGRLYVVERADGRVIELPGEDWGDPRFSPDGKSAAAIRQHELHVIEIDAGASRPLTSGATETLTHGTAEFVAQEEMDRHRGYWWSPDSDAIAYQETDLSAVEKLYIADPFHPEKPPQGYSYPRAGTPNARVRLGVVSLAGGPTRWVQWDAEAYPYLARVQWSEHAPLTILVQNREQREERLLAVDPTTGLTRELLVERDAAWLNLQRGAQMPLWLRDGSGFLWLTERRGEWQLELRGADGGLVRELTPVSLRCTRVVDLDEGSGSVVVSGGPDARETHLFRVSLALGSDPSGQSPALLTEGPGQHSAVFSRDHSTYVYHYSTLDGTVGAEVRRRDGSIVRSLPSVAEEPPFLPQVELVRVARERQYDCAIVRPRDFQQGRRYPVVLQVYAGPTVKVVSAGPRGYLRAQWTADHGYIVVSLDGRGTPGHGREWERAVCGNLIDIALEDQVAGLKALGEIYPEMDLSRVGVTGWSFGGYFAAMATIRRPDVFRCGVAGAPVTDWHDYDTHYTERYMGLPEANPDGYQKSSVLTYAAELERPLLLIHGITDDNVYFLHTLKLLDALFMAGKHCEFLPLAGTHMAGADPTVQIQLASRSMQFFMEHLEPACDAPSH